MIESFDELEQAYKNNEYEEFHRILQSLSEIEVKALRHEIDTWDNHYIDVGNMLDCYFGIEQVPKQILKEMFYEDLDLALEIHNGCTTDTMVRELLIDALMKKIGCTQYPTYGDSSIRVSQFMTSFYEKTAERGIVLRKEQ